VHLSRIRRAAAAALVAVVLVCVELAAPAVAGPRVIKGLSTRWSPASVTIERGTVVRWKGVSAIHNVYSYGSNWSFAESLPVGGSVRRRFTRRGTFRFYCTIHASLSGSQCTGMCGTVRVVA
jgi:plastocyanin